MAYMLHSATSYTTLEGTAGIFANHCTQSSSMRGLSKSNSPACRLLGAYCGVVCVSVAVIKGILHRL